MDHSDTRALLTLAGNVPGGSAARRMGISFASLHRLESDADGSNRPSPGSRWDGGSAVLTRVPTLSPFRP